MRATLTLRTAEVPCKCNPFFDCTCGEGLPVENIGQYFEALVSQADEFAANALANHVTEEGVTVIERRANEQDQTVVVECEFEPSFVSMNACRVILNLDFDILSPEEEQEAWISIVSGMLTSRSAEKTYLDNKHRVKIEVADFQCQKREQQNPSE